MTSIDGIADLHMSGARAVFRPESERIKRSTLAAAFEEQGMKLESYKRKRRPRAEAMVHVDAGVT